MARDLIATRPICRGASLAFANLSGAYLYAADLAGASLDAARPEQRGSERRYLGRCNPHDRRPERPA